MKNQRHKDHPQTAEELIQSIKADSNIDQRTKAARSMKQLKKAAASDLDGTAIVLLEKELAASATIQGLLMKQIAEANGNDKDSLHMLLKYQSSTRAALRELRKLKASAKKPSSKGIGDLFEAEDHE